MVVREDVLHKIKQSFDLNLYESMVWAAILSRGMAPAGEISDMSNVPRSRVYDILSSLEKKGFVEAKPTKPLMYAAVDPEKAVENAKKQAKKKSTAMLRNLDRLSGTALFEELQGIYNEGTGMVESVEQTGVLRGRQHLYSHMHSLVGSAKKSVRLMSSASGIQRKLELLGEHLDGLKKRGVAVKVATQVNRDSADAVGKLCKAAEVRHARGITSRFCIVDNKDMMFMLMDDTEVHPNYDTGVWVGTPFFVNAMSSVFDMAWKKFDSAESVLKKFQ